MSASQYVDIAFPARGRTVPRDHGYALYSALSRCLPSIHGADWIAIHGFSGWALDAETLALDANSVLRVRAPAPMIAELLELVGATLDVEGHRVRLGSPTVHALPPVAVLDARLVVIRLTGGIAKPFDRILFERRFLAEARRQLGELGIRGELELSGRQSLRVAGQRILGHSVRVLGLSMDDSLKLQVSGLGGKRTMGCGIFRPARIVAPAREVA
jgi:CRISPR-associated protein Cas6